MAQFEIETYEVETSSFANNHRHYLKLISPDLSHGIRHRVHLYFDPIPSNFTNENAVGIAINVGGLNYNGITFSVWFREHTFDEVYDLIRSEKPVFFRYYLKDFQSAPNSTTKWTRSAHIVTGAELPGEGPADPDAALTQITSLLSAEGVAPEKIAALVPNGE